MRVSWKDGLATVATGAAVVLYLLWTNGSAAQGLSVPALAGIVFALGFVGCTSDAANMASVYGPGPDRTAPMSYSVAMTIVGIVGLVAGVVAIVGANEPALGVLVVAIVALWAIATLRHADGGRLAHATR
ncbi:MAG: hypothetical protein ACXVWF_01140 [Actinomycetota bacterium]